jgi:hypothetical protein
MRSFEYASPFIIIIISRRVRWTGHATWMREMRNAYKILAGKCGELRHLEDHVMKEYWESGGIAPRILYVGTRWR